MLPTLKTPDDNKTQAAKVFLNWISQKSLEWAKAGQVPARNEVRESAEFKALKEQSTLGAQIDVLHFLPPVAGIGDAMHRVGEGAQRGGQPDQVPAGCAV